MSRAPGAGGARQPGVRVTRGLGSSLLLTLSLAWLAGPATASEPALTAALEALYPPDLEPIRYFTGEVDLNDDGRHETVVYVAGPMVCGTGGCTTLVFAADGASYRLVSRISVSRPPISVAAGTTAGWRDLIVRVSGGGVLPGYDARLRFDGQTYPGNPSVPPAEPLAVDIESDVVIPAFDAFTDGQPLRESSD